MSSKIFEDLHNTDWNYQIGEFIFSDITTFLSDMLIVSTCLFVLHQFSKRLSPPGFYRVVWFIRCLAISSFIGGLGHLLKAHIEEVYFQLTAWTILGLGVYFLQTFSFQFLLGNTKRLFELAAVVQLVIYWTIQSQIHVFHIAKWHMVVGILLIFTPILLLEFLRNKKSHIGLMVIGVGLLVISALVHGLKLDIHPMYFDHRSVGHVFVVFFVLTLRRAFLMQTDTYEARITVSSKLS